MNAHQGNPFVDKESGEIGSVPNFDTTRLFNVFTYLQTALGSLLVSLVRRGERKVKTSFYIKILCMALFFYKSHLKNPLKNPTSLYLVEAGF